MLRKPALLESSHNTYGHYSVNGKYICDLVTLFLASRSYGKIRTLVIPLSMHVHQRFRKRNSDTGCPILLLFALDLSFEMCIVNQRRRPLQHFHTFFSLRPSNQIREVLEQEGPDTVHLCERVTLCARHRYPLFNFPIVLACAVNEIAHVAKRCELFLDELVEMPKVCCPYGFLEQCDPCSLRGLR